MKQSEFARRSFVGYYRELKPYFAESLLEDLRNQEKTFDEALEDMRFYYENVDAPAKLWDHAGTELRKTLWNALIDACVSVADVYQEKAIDYQSVIGEWSLIEIDDDSERSAETIAIGDPLAGLSEPCGEVCDDPACPCHLGEDDDEDDDDGDDGDAFLDVDDDDDDDDDDSVDSFTFPNGEGYSVPCTLYHATPIANLDDIIINGLKAMRRGCVTLHPTIDAAKKVALRHIANGTDADMVVFEVNAERLDADVFDVLAKNYGHGDIYEVSEVPASYLNLTEK